MPVRPDLLAVSDLMDLDRTTCNARAKRTGKQCERPAVPGTTVCWHHGGAAPQVQAAALRRLLDTLVPQAMSQLERMLTDPNVADSLALRAALDVLDRAGVKTAAEPVRHEHEVVVNHQLDAAISQVLARRLPDVVGQLGEGALDAEVVDESPTPQ